ncbi:MAG: BatD family protein [SAR324 cluster bacterium]|nr:BatD family protein [SAR324 cluster bacterium]
MIYANLSLAEVSAWVDKNPVVVGEMFRLHIEAKNVDDPEEPDLSEIRDLQVLNRSVQNQTSIVGTSITRTVKWTYVMLAPSSGNYRIPALQVGSEKTIPIALKAEESSQNPNNQIVRLEVDVSPKEVYPQQQVLIRVRIIRTGAQLENESLTPFELAGIQIEKVNQRSFRKVKNGKRQLITEISYVLLPEKSGTILLPQLSYQGNEIRGGNSQGNFGNFGNFGNIFQQRGRRIFSNSEEQTIQVKALPVGFKGWWLPAAKLELEEQWLPDPPEFRVGEPVTRTLTVNAYGVFGNQIPELSFELPEKMKAYADQPSIETDKTQDGLKGTRVEKWAIIPGQAGRLELPEISVAWWDVRKDEIRTSVFPARIIEVLPATVDFPAAPVTQETAIETKKASVVVTQEPASADQKVSFWKVLAIVFAILWGATMLLWFFLKKNNAASGIEKEEEIKRNKELALRSATKKVEKALSSGEAETVQIALLTWADSVWSENPPQGIEQIGERIPQLKNGIKTLNSVLYGKQCKENSLEELQKEFCGLSFTAKNEKNNRHSQLSPLYPES